MESEFSIINVYGHLACSISYFLLHKLLLSLLSFISFAFCFLITLTFPPFYFSLYFYPFLVTYPLFCLIAELSIHRRVAFLYHFFTPCSDFSCCNLVGLLMYIRTLLM